MISVIVFSKNRPFQLQQYLISLFKFVDQEAQVFVIFKADTAYSVQYEQLINEFSNVSFISQTTDDLLPIIEDALQHIGNQFMMFGVDDVLFYRSIPTSDIIQYLELYADTIVGCSLRLNPYIQFCHSAGNVRMCVPRLTDLTEQLSYFRLGEGSFDWDYPYELSATIYPTKSMISLIQSLKWQNKKFNTPNFIEEAMAMSYLHYKYNKPFNNNMLCMRKPCCSIITINRVQDEFQNPIFESGPSDEELAILFDRKVNYDYGAYANKSWDSVHIGDFLTSVHSG